MLSRRRIVLIVLAVLALAVAYTAWVLYAAQRDLRAAQGAADDLLAAVDAGDQDAQNRATSELVRSARSAADTTDGFWWSALTFTPVVGDDLDGIRALSRSLDEVATNAIEPLSRVSDDLDRIPVDGGADLDVVTEMQPTVTRSSQALARAYDLVEDQDTSGFVGLIRERYDEYVQQVGELEGTLAATDKAVTLMPEMLGDDGPRNYLLVFTNNAEVRSLSGIAGSWAQLTADDGQLTLGEQGNAQDMGSFDDQVVELTAEERGLYDIELGRFFQNPPLSLDFPLAADVFEGFWAERYPDTPLAGVVMVDPVGMSYILEGTGPVRVGDEQLTSDTIVPYLLNDVYREVIDPAEQDALFEEAARNVFQAITQDVRDPRAMLAGFAQAASERRLLMAPTDMSQASVLDGTAIAGQLSGDDGAVPHLDISMSDGTESKMSYYLRYSSEVTSVSCTDGVQTLEGRIEVQQTIDPAEAAELPEYLTGAGIYGIPQGQQLLFIRVLGPYGGEVSDFRYDGDTFEQPLPLELDGRPAARLSTVLSDTDTHVFTFTATTGAEQSDDGRVQITPGIAPGSLDSAFASSC